MRSRRRPKRGRSGSTTTAIERRGGAPFARRSPRVVPTSEVEVRLRQPDGQSRWVRLSSEIQYDEAGEATRVLGAVVDIQMLKEAASARARALADAERTGRAKDEFLATMSHELRTPLNAMLGWAKILKTGQLDDKKLAHGLAVIERNAQAQARLVSDLLDVSRIISGKLRLAVQKIDVAAVVERLGRGGAPGGRSQGRGLARQGRSGGRRDGR